MLLVFLYLANVKELAPSPSGAFAETRLKVEFRENSRHCRTENRARYAPWPYLRAGVERMDKKAYEVILLETRVQAMLTRLDGKGRAREGETF